MLGGASQFERTRLVLDVFLAIAIFSAGALITCNNIERDRARENRELVKRFSEDLQRRRHAAALLINAFDKELPPNVIQRRKAEYDDAYLRWNARAIVHYLEAAQIAPTESAREEFRPILDRLHPMHERLDQDLLTLFRTHSIEKNQALIDSSRSQNVAIGECGRGLAEVLFEYARHGSSGSVDLFRRTASCIAEP